MGDSKKCRGINIAMYAWRKNLALLPTINPMKIGNTKCL